MLIIYISNPFWKAMEDLASYNTGKETMVNQCDRLYIAGETETTRGRILNLSIIYVIRTYVPDLLLKQ